MWPPPQPNFCRNGGKLFSREKYVAVSIGTPRVRAALRTSEGTASSRSLNSSSAPSPESCTKPCIPERRIFPQRPIAVDPQPGTTTLSAPPEFSDVAWRSYSASSPEVPLSLDTRHMSNLRRNLHQHIRILRTILTEVPRTGRTAMQKPFFRRALQRLPNPVCAECTPPGAREKSAPILFTAHIAAIIIQYPVRLPHSPLGATSCN